MNPWLFEMVPSPPSEVVKTASIGMNKPCKSGLCWRHTRDTKMEKCLSHDPPKKGGSYASTDRLDHAGQGNVVKCNEDGPGVGPLSPLDTSIPSMSIPIQSSHMGPKDRGSFQSIILKSVDPAIQVYCFARLNHIHPTGGLTDKSPSYKFLVVRSLSRQPGSVLEVEGKDSP